MQYGQTLPLAVGQSTVLADVDFETYSEAGYDWDDQKGKWVSILGPGKQGGLSAVGLQKYAEHPSTEILAMWYDLKDGKGRRCWMTGMPFPDDFRQHLAEGKLIAAWHSSFEERIWRLVGVPKYGFPELPTEQLRCDMAKARAHCLPGALAKAGAALQLDAGSLKLKDGKRLIRKFCVPRNPTKKDARRRITPVQDPEGVQLHAYCEQDIVAEAAVSAVVPDLNPIELAYWQVDQECNRRGVRMDKEAIDAICEILTGLYTDYDRQISQLTGGQVSATSEVQKIITWLHEQGVHTDTLDAAALDRLLDEATGTALAVIKLRKAASSAAVKKAFNMQRMLSRDGRLHDLFIYHSARTGRDAGADAQPQNLPNSGPTDDWCADDVERALHYIKHRDVQALTAAFGDPIGAISGCLRGLFIADEGHDFISTDYSAIEAVVAAALAGEQWRLDTFARQEDIYLASVAKIKGRTLAEYDLHKITTGAHHPDRKIGKVAELASGFGGWIGAWRAFGADNVFSSEDELKKAILAWRAESPAIVEMWGGQSRWSYGNKIMELYGLEGAAIAAVQNPGQVFEYRGIKYQVLKGTLYCTLISGRRIAYHEANVVPNPGRGGLKLLFSGWNTNPKMGPIGWVRLETYGGKLFENVVQGTARDILAHAAINCERQGYKVVLRVHDELVTMRPEGEGSVEELEAICGDMPHWARGWPVRATGGWRGKRYRKD